MIFIDAPCLFAVFCASPELGCSQLRLVVSGFATDLELLIGCGDP